MVVVAVAVAMVVVVVAAGGRGGVWAGRRADQDCPQREDDDLLAAVHADTAGVAVRLAGICGRGESRMGFLVNIQGEGWFSLYIYKGRGWFSL